MSKPYFIMLVGIPGSGKSRWAKEIVSEATAIVCPDNIRKGVSGDASTQTLNLEVWAIAKEQIAALLKEGKNVILDATNVDYRGWKDVIESLPECQMVAKLFEVEPEVACRRIEKDLAEKVDRSDVPDYAVYRCYGQYLHTKKIINYHFVEVT